MALTKCKECGKQVSTKAESCPTCGAKLKNKGNRMGCGCFLVLIFVIGIIGTIFKGGNNKGGNNSTVPTSPPPPALPAADQIPYQTVEQWKIPNGGYGRAIVIDPKYKSEKDMKKLAECLKRDTSQDRNAFIFIFDDKVAAANRKAAIEDRLGKNESAHYDAHMIGSYFRNINTGHHAITINLEGVNGPAKEIPQ